MALAACMLLLTWFGFTSKMNYMKSGRSTGFVVPDTIYNAQTLLKAIPCSDAATELIGFEVHTKRIKHAGGTHTEYNVVMRSLDPMVDTYKMYCHDIIADLSAGIGANEEVTINVFDSFEAYCFYNNADPFKQDEDALLAQHLVATYEQGRRCDDEPYSTLTYYPYAGNTLRERIDYSM